MYCLSTIFSYFTNSGKSKDLEDNTLLIFQSLFTRNTTLTIERWIESSTRVFWERSARMFCWNGLIYIEFGTGFLTTAMFVRPSLWVIFCRKSEWYSFLARSRNRWFNFVSPDEKIAERETFRIHTGDENCTMATMKQSVNTKRVKRGGEKG